MSSAIVMDHDMISKIRARLSTRNEQGYNSLMGLALASDEVRSARAASDQEELGFFISKKFIS